MYTFINLFFAPTHLKCAQACQERLIVWPLVYDMKIHKFHATSTRQMSLVTLSKVCVYSSQMCADYYLHVFPDCVW